MMKSDSCQATKNVFDELRQEIRLVKFPPEETEKKNTPNKFVTIVMPDGKKVKQFKKVNESHVPLTLTFARKTKKGDVYVREDGKIVRLVKSKDKKRKEKLIDEQMKEEIVRLREQRDEEEEKKDMSCDEAEVEEERIFSRAKAETASVVETEAAEQGDVESLESNTADVCPVPNKAKEQRKVRLSYVQRAALKGKVVLAKAEYMRQMSKINTDLTNMKADRYNRVGRLLSTSCDADSVVSDETSLTEAETLSVEEQDWDAESTNSSICSFLSDISEEEMNDFSASTHVEEEPQQEEQLMVRLSYATSISLKSKEVLAKAEYMREMSKIAQDLGNMKAERFRFIGKLGSRVVDHTTSSSQVNPGDETSSAVVDDFDDDESVASCPCSAPAAAEIDEDEEKEDLMLDFSCHANVEEEKPKRVRLSYAKRQSLKAQEALAKAEYMRNISRLATDMGNMKAERFRFIGKKL